MYVVRNVVTEVGFGSGVFWIPLLVVTCTSVLIKSNPKYVYSGKGFHGIRSYICTGSSVFNLKLQTGYHEVEEGENHPIMEW